jgi:hypothetical protein
LVSGTSLLIPIPKVSSRSFRIEVEIRFPVLSNNIPAKEMDWEIATEGLRLFSLIPPVPDVKFTKKKPMGMQGSWISFVLTFLQVGEFNQKPLYEIWSELNGEPQMGLWVSGTMDSLAIRRSNKLEVRALRGYTLFPDPLPVSTSLLK